MTAWLSVIYAIFQVVLLLLQSHASKEAAVKQDKADLAKGVSDAIASGDVSKINATIQGLRK